jgi:hypothetical protein
VANFIKNFCKSETGHAEPFGIPQGKLREESGIALDPSLRSG